MIKPIVFEYLSQYYSVQDLSNYTDIALTFSP